MSLPRRPDAAIVFEPDGYEIAARNIMGRQAAGNGFLRAAVNAAQGRPLLAYTAHRKSAEAFGKIVRQLDAEVNAQWIPADRLSALAKIGTLYIPGPELTVHARIRQRIGAAAYSLVGVTHTTASHAVMHALADMLTGPVMPWDALICTSEAVVKTVQAVWRREREYLQLRLGVPLTPPMPRLPVIPLGVHVEDFRFAESEKDRSRSALEIDKNSVVVLFVGRLSFHAKAHPHAMYRGLQEVSVRTGKSLVLIQCGWFANEAIERAFREGARQICPGVRSIVLDGRNPDLRRQAWGAADIFMSLSDNIQETFGLTPVEAMAAGLPVIVSDWDGYRETVRDGEDGYCIPTWMPAAGHGTDLAQQYQLGQRSYDMYCGLSCMNVSLDDQHLIERLTALVTDESLRKQIGERGRQRAVSCYDWSVVYAQYQRLWEELAAERARATRSEHRPSPDSRSLDPFELFGHYATRQLGPQTRVQLCSGASVADYVSLCNAGLFSYAAPVLPKDEWVKAIFEMLREHEYSITGLVEGMAMPIESMLRSIAVLAKMGFVRLIDPDSGL